MSKFIFNRPKIILSGEILLIIILIASCAKPFVRKAPKGAYYLYQNKIEIGKGGGFSKSEKKTLTQRLYVQLDENAKVKSRQKFVFLKMLKHPSVYDSSYSRISCENIAASLFHIGYYNAKVTFGADTSRKKVSVTYKVESGKPTLIDTISYKLRQNGIILFNQDIKKHTYLKKNSPVTKAAVITEIGRLVDSFRNNGYYKFTASELKIQGDTTIKALTYFTDDPFEQINILAEAQKQRDSPRIKLSVVLNTTSDSSRFNRYYINKICIISDYRQGDEWNDSSLKKVHSKNYDVGFHKQLFKISLFEKNILLKPGQLYRQSEYFNTLTSLNNLGVWQSVDIQFEEIAFPSNLINVIIKLTPSRKFGFETGLELSYSAASNTSNLLSGNLFGLSGSLSLLNRNLAKDAIKMTHNFRGGIELNKNVGLKGKVINSNEISYNNNTSFPRLILAAVPNVFIGKALKNNGESFINLGTSYNTRLDLFNLQSINSSFGWTGNNKYNWKWVFAPISIGFSNLFNQSDSFRHILNENPFLNYSYNSALYAGMSFSLSKFNSHLNHPRSLSKEQSMKLNLEESGLTWGLLPYFTKYKRRYIKGDFEIKHNIKYAKSTLAFRGFLGIGIPLLGSDTNKTLPFFNQYLAGGSNSMRGWPVRGIGPGGRPLVPYESGKTIFNDRTGDMQFEVNAEYRYDIAKIIPNTLTLRGAIFTDIGNIWNINNTKLDGTADSSQFNIKTFYSQLGVTAGTGFRLDFNYFVVRLDLGFRIKRPELFYLKDGWNAPNIGIKDVFNKLFSSGDNDEYRKWRYENFNFTIGIGYSF